MITWRVLAFGAILALLPRSVRADGEVAAPVPAPKVPVLAARLGGEWGYRRFFATEPTSTERRYVASGIFALGLNVDAYPFRDREDVLRNFGAFGSYTTAIGLRSRDIDTDREIATTFYHYDLGAQYRLPTGTPITLTFRAGLERWVFDFNRAGPPANDPRRAFPGLVPSQHLSLVKAGVFTSYAVPEARLSFPASIELMLPLSMDALGDRTPTGLTGARGLLGVTFDLLPAVAIDLAGQFTLFTFHLSPVPGRAEDAAKAVDQNLAVSLGCTVRY